MQKVSLFSLFLSLPLLYALPHIPTTPLTLTLPITGFQHQLHNFTLITDQIYNILSHPSFHVNARWYYRDEHIVPHEIAILCGADQIHISSHKHDVRLTINGHRMIHGHTYVGNLLMHHIHENSNTSIEIIEEHNKMSSIIMVSSLFAIKMDITSNHTITLSLALLSRDWIQRGRTSEYNDDIPLHGLVGQTYSYRSDHHIDGDEHDYIMSSLWSTDGIYSRYRDDLYNHIDDHE